ncbi:phage shock protein A [Catalinimonas alkaloidigena]|uniref:Phage shock protein A n=1 Tax=Catalinimonas alkaloidigena TaxID=1075417 RepID=A0A1G9ECC5_9BACT|nr:PspA/IM30 family protein [Catalinimonas alkaloidigena]SDK73685.1 phage shock protein A [Catalinimonas alkaloidigena]
MSIFKRLFKIGEAETNAAIDRLENPIKMTEQGIRDMKAELDKSLHGLAEIKAMAIRAQNDMKDYQTKAEEYEQKAMQLLQRAQQGHMDSAEADRLATEALAKKAQNEAHVKRTTTEKEQFDRHVEQMEGNIKRLKADISKWENELKSLKARVNVSAASQRLNKQLAQIDSSDTASMLERMKEKVAQSEALAESYGQIANESRSLDEEIDRALDATDVQASADLAALKAKMGLGPSNAADAKE